MARPHPDDWRPSGIANLETNAWCALREANCTCVIAGPGAGKTEFLAQRAVYLLETGTCPLPYRVLAISFKRDAAENLAARVRKRCPPDLSKRFVSLTFDAFTKGLVDRFINAIPAIWRPTRPYNLVFLKSRQVQDFLSGVIYDAPRQWRSDIAALTSNEFEPRYIGSSQLPLILEKPTSGIQLAISRWWAERLPKNAKSSLTFTSINRLAELLLRTNSHIRHALRITYPFVFIDEFQDATYAQYDFLLSAFANGHAVVTAVGDDKQRIMTWAGARVDAFQRFETNFRATRIPLQFNFRSSPDLIRIQHVVAQALDPGTAPTVAQATRIVDGDVAQVWMSSTKVAEAQYLAAWLSNDMAQRDRSPRDYAILVRQKADNYEAEISDTLVGAGLRLRNESHELGRTSLQDLLADELCRITVAILRLGLKRRSPDAWCIVAAALQDLRCIAPGDDIAVHRVERVLMAFIKELRENMDTLAPSRENAALLADRIFRFLDLGAVRRSYLIYGTGDLLNIMVEAFKLHFASCANNAADWATCLDAFEGVNHIPLMTVHKSKGLEYDTIIFIGLDDNAWWSHTPRNPEGLATFFVALSRAKQRAVFAFCKERGQRRLIADLYDLLTEAGVPEIPL